MVMVEIPKAIKKRFKKSVGKSQHKIEKLKNEFTDGNEEVLNVFKYIVSNVFGFNEQKESIRLPIDGMAYYYIGLKIENEIKYIIEIGSPTKNIQNDNLSIIIEYAMHNHIEWFVKTNGILWDIYRNKCKQPNEYEKVCSINFLELNSKNHDALSSLYILCKESHNKNITTDLYNRNHWYGYLNEDCTSIDYMFLVNVCLYENGSEKVHIPLLDLTYWCDEPFIGRQNAERAIEKYLKDEYEKEFDSGHKFETIAYHKESIYIKTNVPIWW